MIQLTPSSSNVSYDWSVSSIDMEIEQPGRQPCSCYNNPKDCMALELHNCVCDYLPKQCRYDGIEGCPCVYYKSPNECMKNNIYGCYCICDNFPEKCNRVYGKHI